MIYAYIRWKKYWTNTCLTIHVIFMHHASCYVLGNKLAAVPVRILTCQREITSAKAHNSKCHSLFHGPNLSSIWDKYGTYTWLNLPNLPANLTMLPSCENHMISQIAKNVCPVVCRTISLLINEIHGLPRAVNITTSIQGKTNCGHKSWVALYPSRSRLHCIASILDMLWG